MKQLGFGFGHSGLLLFPLPAGARWEGGKYLVVYECVYMAYEWRNL